MASTNFKLFDENKTNMMSDTEYNINTQRLNGVQAGIASSQLQNKTLYQTSLVAYSLAQIMMQNGYDANDSAAVSAFVGNMSNSLLQKVLDKATSVEAKAGTITNKWISPATMKAAALLLSGGTMSGPINMGNNKITNLADPTNSLDSANKKYVDESNTFKKAKIADNLDLSFKGLKKFTINYPNGFTISDVLNSKFVLFEFLNLHLPGSYDSIFAALNTSDLFNLFYSNVEKTFDKVSILVPIGKVYDGDRVNVSDLVKSNQTKFMEAKANNIFAGFYCNAQVTGKVSIYFVI